MYSKGHFGLNLILMSAILWGFPLTFETVFLIFFSAGLATFPDRDIKWQRMGVPVKHRGFTHSLFFAVIIGLCLSFVYGYGQNSDKWGNLGFLAGFMGIIGHMIGDLITHHKFKFFYPVSHRSFGGWGLTSASNKFVNEGLFKLGITFFVLYVLNGFGVIGELLSLL
jgi:inner membrane protein